MINKTYRTTAFLYQICALTLLLITPQIVNAKPALVPVKPGTLLIATKNLAGTSFEKTIILITQHGPQGTTGIAINRPSEFTLTDVVPDASKHKAGLNPLFLGGPVHPSSVLFLTSSNTGHALTKIIDGIYLGGGTINVLDTLKHIQTGTNFRAYAGYAGWAPGQLRNEINRNDWILSSSNQQQLFMEDTSALWRKLSRKNAGNWI